MFTNSGIFSVSRQVKQGLAAALTGAVLLTTAGVSFAVRQQTSSAACVLTENLCDSNMACTYKAKGAKINCDGPQGYEYPDKRYIKRTGSQLSECVKGTGPCSNNGLGICSVYFISKFAGCSGIGDPYECAKKKFCQPK